MPKLKIYVKNAPDTSHLTPPTPYKSWIEYWECNGGVKLEEDVFYACPCCGKAKERQEMDGSHVTVRHDGSGKIFIIPLCDECNHVNVPFRVDIDLLVPAP